MSLPLALSSENTPSMISELLYRLKIRDVMTKSLICAERTDTMRTLQQRMKSSAITGLPVCEGKRLLGIVSMDDIIRSLDDGSIDQIAEQHMTRTVTVLEEDMPLAFGLSYMEKYRFGRFPVLNRHGELVGIITSRDIIVHLLVAMNHEVEVMEEKLKGPIDPSTITVPSIIKLDFSTRRFDFENAGKPSAEIKKICKEHNLDPKLTRRIAVASYELEMNQVIHSLGGTLSFELEPNEARVIASDNGPGIEDLASALSEGWSTATEWVRSLGFGAGMGLPNTKRVSDHFFIDSTLGKGTIVIARFDIPQKNDSIL